MMRVIWTLCAFLLLATCAAPSSESGKAPKAETYSAKDHIPPPPFTDNDTIGQICGGMTAGPSQTCSGKTEYCHRDISDMCGAADAPGICREKPMACPENYDPVCGCDGQPYPNECAANRAGVSAAQRGTCPA